MVKFKRITYSEVDILRNMTLRRADIRELKASTGMGTWDALKYSVQHSNEWTEIAYDSDTGEVLSVFGLASYQGAGIPWMVGSPSMLKHKNLLMRYSKKVIAEMLEIFPVIANYVDSRNTVHIRWLKHMGFKFNGFNYELDGVIFKYFYKERN